MTKRILLLSIIVFSLLISCEEEKITNPKPVVVKYDTVKIGNQIWMTKNLDVDHYRNGDSIPEVRDSSEWVNLKTGAWCYYNNDPKNGEIYGKLYNWYAVNDPRGLAPLGWHVAIDEEWTALENCLGEMAGGLLKSTGTIEGGDGLWYSPNEGATNESGFSALPGGWRSVVFETFVRIGYSGNWWTATEDNVAYAWNRYVRNSISYIYRDNFTKENGFSVRCVRD